MPFVKLDCGLVDSTIFCEPNDVFKAWITLLVKAGPDGIARITAPALGLLCRVDTPRAHEILTQFEAPEEDSRTQGGDGARIRRVDGGYLILNYQKYRAKRDEDARREQNRKAQRRHRECQQKSATVSHGQPKSAQAEAEAEVEVDKNSPVKSVENLSLLVTADKKERAKPRRATALPTDFLLTKERRNYAVSKEVSNPEKEFEAFRAHHEAHGKVMKSWDAAWRTWCLNAKKFRGNEPPRGAGSMGGVLR